MSQVPYAIVKMARDSARPTGLDYINHIFQGFVELHGDRRFGDDPAIVGGIAMLGDVPVTVIAIEKGHTARERSQRSFGAPHPEGCASILWKDAKKAEEAAASLKLTAEAAAGLGVVDRVLSERDIGKEPFYTRIRDALTKELAALAGDPELLTKRYNRFRRMGVEAVRETL